MFINYLKVFIQNLLRQKLIAFINIIGLAVGVAVFFVIALYVQDQYSYGKRWEKSDQIVRVTQTLSINAQTKIKMADDSPIGTIPVFMEYFPESFELATAVVSVGEYLEMDENLFEEDVLFVDTNFLAFFDLEVLEGSLEETLAVPNKIAIEAEYAKTLFGSDAIGRKITQITDKGTKIDFTVTAIYRYPDGKGVLEFKTLTLLSPAVFPKLNEPNDSWWDQGINGQLFFLLKEGVDVSELNRQLEGFVKEKVPVPFFFPNVKDITALLKLQFQPLADMYFEPMSFQDISGSRITVNSFAAAAILVLLVAVINFVVLSIAQSIERNREVGIRKAAGAFRFQLIKQFFVEAFLQVVISTFIALALQELLLPLFANMMGAALDNHVFSFANISGICLITVGITATVSFYPAIILSSTNPSRAIKANGAAPGASLGLLRNALVGFQFAMAIGLIVVSSIIYLQMHLTLNRDKGFDSANVVSMVTQTNEARDRQESMITEIKKLSGVEHVTKANRMANSLGGSTQSFAYQKNDDTAAKVDLTSHNVGFDFFETYNMQLLAGRGFDRERDTFPTENSEESNSSTFFQPTKVVLNESSARALGYVSPQAAVGSFIYRFSDFEKGDNRSAPVEVVGVVADSQFSSLRAVPALEAFHLVPWAPDLITIRASDTAMPTIREDLTQIWESFFDVGEPKIFFGRDNIADEFAREQKEGRMLAGFSLLGILVSCLGLYGLVAFESRRRTKEIGVRKVLGGKRRNILFVFLKQFSVPVLCANLIAWPLAIWVMQGWLQRFPYQIDAWWFLPICLIAGVLVVLIAGLTISMTVSKAYAVRPVQALRYE